MPITLEQVRELVRSVAREGHIDADVVGVVGGQGTRDYAEALVVLAPDARRVSVSVARNSDVATVRRQVDSQLSAAAGRPMPK